MLATTAMTQVPLTLSIRRWETALEGLATAALIYDSPGICYCPDRVGDQCDTCALTQYRADMYREFVFDIGPELTATQGRLTLTLTRVEASMVATALSEAADYQVRDGVCVECCGHGARLCGYCRETRVMTVRYRTLADHIGRHLRRTQVRRLRPSQFEAARQQLAELAELAEVIDDLTAQREYRALTALLNRRSRRPRGARARSGRR